MTSRRVTIKKKIIAIQESCIAFYFSATYSHICILFIEESRIEGAVILIPRVSYILVFVSIRISGQFFLQLSFLLSELDPSLTTEPEQQQP